MREYYQHFCQHLWGWVVIAACLALQVLFVVLAIADCAWGIFED